MSLTITHAVQNDDTILITLVGRLDGTSAEECENTISALFEQHTFSTLVFDLAGLDYISSAGLRVLLKTQKQINASGGHAALEGMQAPVAEVIRLAGILEHTDVLSTDASGDAYLDAIQRRIRMRTFDTPD